MRNRTALCLLLSALSAKCCAECYYVSPTGIDSSKGTAAQPLRWIQTAINKTKPGDTVMLMPGTHAVKPGDSNITFSGKKGTEKAPITLTTSGPGVIIDLTEANTEWGGFRISDGSEWIVVDGGGKPSVFDESSYCLVIQNAAYHAAFGDERSNIVCRPLTIQQATNVTVKNIFAKRSMGGMGIFGTSTRKIVVDNCRIQPGEAAHDKGVSHGIYVGGGADEVLMHHCFIRWGGDGRLGLQNNHGGAVSVVLEDSFVTECQAVIKSFNGGGVKAKNCYFWKIDETPLQGNATAEGCTNAEPPSDVMGAANVPAKPVAAGKVDTASSPKAPIAAPPAVKVAATPAAAKAPRDLEPQRKALREILQKTQTSTSVKSNITVFGKPESVLFAGADATGLKVSMDGNVLPLRWKEIQDMDLADLTLACQPEDTNTLFHVGVVAFANHRDTLFDNVLTKLLKADAGRATSLLDLCNGN